MNATFDSLREKYPVFEYVGFDYFVENDNLRLKFDFKIGDTIAFSPKMTLKAGEYSPNWENFDLKSLEKIVFNIGLVELVSYWKSTCSPKIFIRPFKLSDDEQLWWRKLYWYGLGEFCYKNEIKTTPFEFFNFEFPEDAPLMSELSCEKVEPSDNVIVPIGGGKDSVVTLEELRRERNVVPFIINPRGATLECARVAGFSDENQIVILQREIDAKLLELNAKGFLNGHTPFSAMLAFYSILVSSVTGIRDVALSNESSANEATIPGTYINHQYSKSLEFELDFQYYVKEYLNDNNHYFSYLRKFSELQIAEKFASYPQYFKVFKSCNVGSKEDKWCGNCPKCLFAYIILAPFIEDSVLQDIFGKDLLNDPQMEQTFDELAGLSKSKPFECVGTIDEVNEALQRICTTHDDKFLIKHYLNVRLQQIEDELFEDYVNMAP